MLYETGNFLLWCNLYGFISYITFLIVTLKIMLRPHTQSLVLCNIERERAITARVFEIQVFPSSLAKGKMTPLRMFVKFSYSCTVCRVANKDGQLYLGPNWRAVMTHMSLVHVMEG